MRVTVIIASDFAGMMEYFIALILWCIGTICSVIAHAFIRSRNPKRRSGPFAFIAIVCSMIILLLVVKVSFYYERVQYTPLIAGILPGVAGVMCLVYDRPRRR